MESLSARLLVFSLPKGEESEESKELLVYSLPKSEEGKELLVFPLAKG